MSDSRDGDLAVEGLTKEFVSEAGRLVVLNGAGLRMKRGEALAVTGPSGSGKSTLLYILGTLERPTSGRRLPNRSTPRIQSTRRVGPERCMVVPRSKVGKRFEGPEQRRPAGYPCVWI